MPHVTGTQPIILDDLDSALARLTDLGKPIVRPVADTVRRAVYLFAAVHSWRIVEHGSFAGWAGAEIRDADRWLVLDPLFPSKSLPRAARMLRLTRQYVQEKWQLIATLPSDLADSLAGKSVGIIDDACATGETFRYVSRLIADAGGCVCRFVVCASTASARTSVGKAIAEAGFATFLRGDYSAVHLRDGCPGLPFAGRPHPMRTLIHSSLGPVTICMPSVVTGQLWQVLYRDRGVCWAMMVARRQLAERLSATLGRRAIVGDMPLLGPDIPLLLYPQQTATADTPLADLLR